MAIKCGTGNQTIETVSGLIKVGSTPQYNTSGAYYYGSDTKTFAQNVQYVKITSGSVGFAIDGNTVRFSYSTTVSGGSQRYTADVTIGDPVVTIDNIVTASGTPIDYVKVKNATNFIWTRPSTFSLQLPWDYLKSWSLTRESSTCVDSAPGTCKSYDSSYTGTTSYTLPLSTGLRYGDNVKLSWTLKPGATFTQASPLTATISRTCTGISKTTTVGSTGYAPDPTISATCGNNWAKGDRDTMIATSTRNQITLKVTKPSEISDFKVKVYIAKWKAASWYSNNAWPGYTATTYNTSANLYYNGSKVSTDLFGDYETDWTYLGELSSSTQSGTYTLTIDGGDYAWPRGIQISVALVFDSAYHNAHKYTNSNGAAYHISSAMDYFGDTSTPGGSGGTPGGGNTGNGGYLPS